MGKDVAGALGYERETKAIVDRVDEEDRKMVGGKTQSQTGTELGQRGGWLINESGLYGLILSSKHPAAVKTRGQNDLDFRWKNCVCFSPKLGLSYASEDRGVT